MNTEKTNRNKYYYNGIMIIISSPSGAGKTTLCKKISSLDKNIFLSISYTTREKRKWFRSSWGLKKRKDEYSLSELGVVLQIARMQ